MMTSRWSWAAGVVLLACDGSGDSVTDAGAGGGGTGGREVALSDEAVTGACGHLEFGPALPLTAVALSAAIDAHDLPQLEPHHRSDIRLPADPAHAGQFAGVVGFTTEEAAHIVLLLDGNVPLTVRTEAGADVASADERAAGEGCAVAPDALARAYDEDAVTAGHYIFALGPTPLETVRLVLHLPAHDEHPAAEGEHTHGEPPHEFEHMTNPFDADRTTAATAGALVYAGSCQICHGEHGAGDGPDAHHQTVEVPSFLDHDLDAAYLMWRTTTGGQTAVLPAGVTSSMPAFELTLSEEDRWRVVTYIEDVLRPAGE